MPTSANPFYADFSGAFNAPFEDFQRLQRQGLEMRQMAAEGPARLAQMQAQTGETVARTNRLNAEAAKSEELKALFGEAGEGAGPQSAKIFRLAQRVAGIDPALATRMYGAGSDMALEEARAGKAEAEAARARAQALERNTNWLYSILGDIRDPQAFEARRMQILSSPGLVTTPENQALLQGTSFEQYRAFPQLVEAERKRALDAVAANRANTLKQFAGASETNAATRAAAEVRRREQGDLRTKTDGTKPIERPAPKDVEQALVYIKNTAEGKDLSGVPLRSAASDVAARALRIHRENPAVSIDVARSRALEELKKTQALRQESTVFGGKRWSYNSLGAEVTPTGRPSGAPRVAPPQPGERTATNPKTGERMVYRNGKWEKLQ